MNLGAFCVTLLHGGMIDPQLWYLHSAMAGRSSHYGIWCPSVLRHFDYRTVSIWWLYAIWEIFSLPTCGLHSQLFLRVTGEKTVAAVLRENGRSSRRSVSTQCKVVTTRTEPCGARKSQDATQATAAYLCCAGRTWRRRDSKGVALLLQMACSVLERVLF